MRSRYAWAVVLLITCLPLWATEGPPRPPELATIGPKPNPIVPPTAAEIRRSIRRGLDFLLQRQNKDGSWGSANITRPGEIYAPVPGRIRPSRPR